MFHNLQDGRDHSSTITDKILHSLLFLLLPLEKSVRLLRNDPHLALLLLVTRRWPMPSVAAATSYPSWMVDNRRYVVSFVRGVWTSTCESKQFIYSDPENPTTKMELIAIVSFCS
eukprot:GHVT01041887.1.p1 GENE.GHVT01041887.1~~GHVT01041887.1.p1  ORF type:complete len:115 (-),score=5.56 GHVT01041887.1:1053-1397(-)